MTISKKSFKNIKIEFRVGLGFETKISNLKIILNYLFKNNFGRRPGCYMIETYNTRRRFPCY